MQADTVKTAAIADRTVNARFPVAGKSLTHACRMNYCILSLKSRHPAIC
jgi:hypothetical protein